jgi:hypothetical protein
MILVLYRAFWYQRRAALDLWRCPCQLLFFPIARSADHQITRSFRFPISRLPDYPITKSCGGAPPPGFNPFRPKVTQCHPSRGPSCPAAMEKTGRGTQAEGCNSQNAKPGLKPGRQKCMFGGAALSCANQANKTRKHFIRISVDNKRIFQYHGCVVPAGIVNLERAAEGSAFLHLIFTKYHCQVPIGKGTFRQFRN